MKVISIKQPWASLIVYGYKEFEFRNWKTKFRGEVLIHASQKVEQQPMQHFKHLPIEFPTGAIIGSVIIRDCLPVTPEWEMNLIEKNRLVYGLSKGRGGYAFQMAEPKVFEKPILAKGRLGFWDYNEN